MGKNGKSPQSPNTGFHYFLQGEKCLEAMLGVPPPLPPPNRYFYYSVAKWILQFHIDLCFDLAAE